MKVELCCKVYSKKTGEEVFRGFKTVTKIFDSMDDFYSYMLVKYGFDSKFYSFVVSGHDIAY